MTRQDSRRAGLAIALMALCLCALTCASVAGFNGLRPRLSLPLGYVTHMCVGFNLQPRVQIGLSWISPYMSSLPPVMLQNPYCALLPWLPVLPQRGGLALP
jgi:hypothetical protein